MAFESLARPFPARTRHIIHEGRSMRDPTYIESHKPKTPISLWCQIGLHAWTKWSDPKQDEEESTLIRYSEQTRVCLRCNTFQQRRRNEFGHETLW
jgi:hypothetical protein